MEVENTTSFPEWSKTSSFKVRWKLSLTSPGVTILSMQLPYDTGTLTEIYEPPIMKALSTAILKDVMAALLSLIARHMWEDEGQMQLHEIYKQSKSYPAVK